MKTNEQIEELPKSSDKEFWGHDDKSLSETIDLLQIEKQHNLAKNNIKLHKGKGSPIAYVNGCTVTIPSEDSI